MERRRNSGTAEDLMDVVALLHWWLELALAPLSHWVPHGVASRPIPPTQTGKQIGELLPTTLRQGFATGGQYLLPLICVLGALISAVRRRTGNAVRNRLGEGFKLRGDGVQEMGGGGLDGGVDLVLTKAGEMTFVRCRQWKGFKVVDSTVCELYGAMAAHGAASWCCRDFGAVHRGGHLVYQWTQYSTVDWGGADAITAKCARRTARSAGVRTTAQGSKAETERLVRTVEALLPANAESLINTNCPTSGSQRLDALQPGTRHGKDFLGYLNHSNESRGTRERRKT